MNFKRAFFIFLAGTSFGIPAHPALAKPGYSNINHYLNFLEHNFASNKSSEVLENLWQALLIDPYAPEIRLYLQRSLGELSLSAVDRIRIISVQDLLKQTQNLSERRQYYAQKNNDLREAVLKEGISEESLQVFLGQLNGGLSRGSEGDPLLYSLEDGSSWDRVQKMLSREKVSLEAEVAHLELQYQGLTRLHQHKTIMPSAAVSSVVLTAGHESLKDVLVISQEEREKKFINSSDIRLQNLEDVKGLIAGLQNQIMVFQQDLQKKDELIHSLRAQVVDMNLNLAQRDKMAGDRIIELAELKRRMDDVQARFDLGQKIIQEKDIQIGSMQKELVYAKNESRDLRKDMADRLEEKDQQIQEMAGMLDIYWKKLNSVSETAEKKDDNVKFLMERLLSVQERLEEKETALQKTHQDLDGFQGQLKSMQDKVVLSPKTADAVIGQDMLDMEIKLRDVKSYLIQQIEENDVLSHYLAEQQEQLDASLQPSQIIP